MARENFQLYIVENPFNSGELRTSLPKGEVVEVDIMQRRARYAGRVFQVKTILSAIRQGWLRAAQQKEVDHIRQHGVSPLRRFQSPDLTAISKERHQQMQDTIPEDLKGEDHLQVAGEQARTLGEIQTPDQYHQVGGAQTNRIAGSLERPQVPHSEALTEGAQPLVRGTLPDSPALRPVTPQEQIPGHPAQELPEGASGIIPPNVSIEDAIAAAEEEAPSEEQLAFVEAKLKESGEKEDYPKKLRFDFDYKHRLSKKREQKMKDMPLQDLHHLMLFLQGRDIADNTDRQITKKATETFNQRIHQLALRNRASRKAEIKEEVAPILPPTDFSFNFDVNAKDVQQIHLSQMVLSIDQVGELIEYYAKVRPDFAKKLTEIRDHRVRSAGGPSKEGNWGDSLQGAEAGVAKQFGGGRKIAPNHGSEIKNPRADGMRTSKPAPNHTPGFLAGAEIINDNQQLINAVTDTQPIIPPTIDEMHQDQKAIDVQIPGDTQTEDVGNQPPPPEVSPLIGTEEGNIQIQSLGDRIDQARKAERIGGNDVQDISSSVNLEDLL